ncbi:MAG: hypothetical protein WA126_00770 [Thermodesulfovibrionales bacterium]
MFVEACTVEPRLIIIKAGQEQIIKPENYDEKKLELEKEVSRLKELSTKGWTEYQVLSLDQMLLDFLKVDDLIARASSRLADLGDYAEDISYDLEKRQYYTWEEQIKKAIDVIEEKRKESNCDKDTQEEVDKCAEKLRAVTRELLDAMADYDLNWATGSAIMRALYIYGVQTIFILIAMGLFPLYYRGETETHMLALFNWGILGISGAITAALWNLRQSNYVEVGFTFGKKEMWKAVLGAGLGLVAGVIIYSMIAGKLLEGNIFPTLYGSSSPKDTYLSIFWAIAAGFSSEVIFDRLRSTMGNV